MSVKHKILLVTLQSANIGNRLQNYALQKVLESKGCDVYTPTYNPPEYDTGKKRIKLYIKTVLGKLGIKKYAYQYLKREREKKYKFFDKTYISNKLKISFNKVEKMNWDQYDLAIVGSDQVWHRWSHNPNELRYFYLEFMPKTKRVAYAASFGFEEFSKEDKVLHEKGISSIRLLSARELSGKLLMEKISGKEVELVLDPTLLLLRDEWKKIEKTPQYKIEGKFMVVYFLGEKTKQYMNIIRKLASERKLYIIDILNIKNPQHFFTTPDEFIWLINNADCVITDSFHAVAFSIIFHKEFIVFKRVQEGFDNMFGRIITLLKICGLENQDDEECISNIGKKIKWEEIDKRIKTKRQCSLKYLYRCLSFM